MAQAQTDLLLEVTKQDIVKKRIAFVADGVKATVHCYNLVFLGLQENVDLAACAEKHNTLGDRQWPYTGTFTLRAETVPGLGQRMYLPDGTEIVAVEYVATLTQDGWLVVSPPEYQYGADVVTISYYTWVEPKRVVMVAVRPDGRRVAWDLKGNRPMGLASQWAFEGETPSGRILMPLNAGLLAGALGRLILAVAVTAGVVAGAYVVSKWLDVRRVEAEVELVREIRRFYEAMGDVVIRFHDKVGDPNATREFMHELFASVGETFDRINYSATIEELLNIIKFGVIAAILVMILRAFTAR